jgi:hypothetical protein
LHYQGVTILGIGRVSLHYRFILQTHWSLWLGQSVWVRNGSMESKQYQWYSTVRMERSQRKTSIEPRRCQNLRMVIRMWVRLSQYSAQFSGHRILIF